jgi:tetratricopeptide (TPR) repeat protein
VKGVGQAVVTAWAVAICLAVMTLSGGCAGAKGKLGAAPRLTGAQALEAGDTALARGNRDEAGRMYLAALKAGADTATVYIRLGDLSLGGGAAAQAQAAYQKALDAKPGNALALQGIGFALFLGGSQNEAVTALTKALERDPRLPRATALLGTIENRQGRPEAALAVFDKFLAVAFDPDVANNRGLSLMQLGRPAEAVGAFERALSAGKNPKFANNLGLALCRLHRYDEAYAAFASVAPESVALNNIGVCYMEGGDKARAQQSFERAIATNPTYYEKAQSNLSRLSAMESVVLPSPPVPGAPQDAVSPPAGQLPQALAPMPPAQASMPQGLAPMPAPAASPAPVVVSPAPAQTLAPPSAPALPGTRPSRPSDAEKADRSERP